MTPRLSELAELNSATVKSHGPARRTAAPVNFGKRCSAADERIVVLDAAGAGAGGAYFETGSTKENAGLPLTPLTELRSTV